MLIPPNTPHKGYATLPFRDLSIHAAQIDFNQFAIVKDYRGEIAGIISIAENCGFSDSLYFSTCFKKHVGCSPSEYRKRITQN